MASKAVISLAPCRITASFLIPKITESNPGQLARLLNHHPDRLAGIPPHAA
jgi:hypothetical protein